VNDKSHSCFGCDVGHHGGEACSPGCDCGCRRPTPAEDLAVRQARLARGQWTDAGGGLQVRLA
jgi:hypothetical protein